MAASAGAMRSRLLGGQRRPSEVTLLVEGPARGRRPDGGPVQAAEQAGQVFQSSLVGDPAGAHGAAEGERAEVGGDKGGRLVAWNVPISDEGRYGDVVGHGPDGSALRDRVAACGRRVQLDHDTASVGQVRPVHEGARTCGQSAGGAGRYPGQGEGSARDGGRYPRTHRTPACSTPTAPRRRT